MATLLQAPYSYFTDNSGNPLVGGKVYTYDAGTTTPRQTFTNSSGSTPASNPVILDAAGRADIWMSGIYKITVKDANDVLIRTVDNVSPSSGSGGDMTKAIYDPANVNQQLVGTTAAQTVTNKIVGLVASTTLKASLNIAQGVAPTSPINGDVWTTSASVYARINGATIDLGAGGGGGSGFTSIVRQVFNSSGTYTPTVGMKYADVEIVGGGGNGAASPNTGRGGGGGGAGGYAKKIISAATIGASQSVTIGGPTGTSSFGAILSAGGGSSGSNANRGAGGSASGGDYNINGSQGTDGAEAGNVGANGGGGCGGSSFFGGAGGGGSTPSGGAGGDAATNSGSGGGGSNENLSAGGAGASGKCIVTEYL